MKRFIVELESYDTDSIEVEAENEEQAKETALEIMGFDYEVTYVEEIEDSE